MIAVSQGVLIFWGIVGAIALVLLVIYRDRVIHWGGKTKVFLSEVIAELRKSTWPTWIELRDSTIVVIVAVIALAIFVGVADLIFTMLIGWLTKRG